MRTLFLTAAACAILAVTACSKTEDETTTIGQSGPVNAVQDMAAGPVGLGSAATIGSNTVNGFVTGAAMGDMYEIESSKIALQKAKSPQVKAFAQMLIDHHTKMSAELKAVLPQAGVTVTPPATLDERRQGMLDNLRAADGEAFDLAYLHQQLAAHLEALTLHKGYGSMGDNAVLKGIADKAAPVVQTHIDEIRKIGGDKLDKAT